ncbi:AAA family ATPase [Paenibacillus sp. BR2-3]|uniref:AAA family ATPase n=1 Tax=Paenibacillus sp. BR2-3 TaxID=3048494 RepID=UPI003977E32B
MNQVVRIAISGTYSTGKTTTTEALSLLSGIPRTHAKTMREILPDAIPGKTLEQCKPAELLQLGIRRFTERAIKESQLDSFISDGSSLHEWIYGKSRLTVGINPNDGPYVQKFKMLMMMPFKKAFEEIIDNFGSVVKSHAKNNYVEFIHLPVEFPLVEDGHRPVSESFRGLSDRLLLDTLDELLIPYHVVSGSIQERLDKIMKIYNWKPIIPIEEAIEEAKRRTNLHMSEKEK